MQLAFQDTEIQLNELDEVRLALESLNYKPKTFGIIPFVDSLSLNEQFSESTLLFGGTKLLKLKHKNLLPKNCIVYHHKETFDQYNYHRYLGYLLLNVQAQFMPWRLVKGQHYKMQKFIKPTSDMKFFPGFVYYPDERNVNEYLRDKVIVDCDLTDDTLVLVNHPIENIKAEYRAFVVNYKIIDITQSNAEGKLKPQRIDDTDTEESLKDFIALIQSVYEPHHSYVIDVCLVDGEYKVVEFNCINCSGLYMHDRAKIYKALLEL